MRSKGSPNVVILITSDATEGQKDKLCTISLENTGLGPTLYHSQTALTQLLTLPSSFPHTQPPKTKAQLRGIQQGFLRQSKMPSSYTQWFYLGGVDFNISINVFDAKAQTHKQTTLSTSGPPGATLQYPKCLHLLHDT